MLWPHDAGAISAVQRVAPVRRTATAEASSAIRDSDRLREPFPRPDPALVSAQDVLRFQQLVFADGSPHLQAPQVSGAEVSMQMSVEAAAAAPPILAVTPADRIAATLRHLPTLNGV